MSLTRTLSTLLLAAFAPVAVAESLLVTDVVIVSPERPEAVRGATVRIEDGRISDVVVGKHKLTADRRIDGDGRYMLPGLIDSHVHLGSNAGMRGDHAQRNRALLDGYRRREPLNYLAHGFTTLIDVSTSQSFVDEWNALPLRPDLEFCIGIPFANGYGMAFEPMDVRFRTPYFLYDEKQADVIPAKYLPDDHTPEAVIDKVVRTDAICVKSYYEDGFGGLFDFPVPSLDLIRTLVAAAHEKDLVVLLHGNSLKAHQFAVDAGVDVIAHGPWHWDEWNHLRSVEPPVERVLAAIVDGDIAMQVTAQVIYGERDLLAGGFLDDDALSSIHSPALIDWYRSDDGAWFRDQLARNYVDNPEIVEKFIGHPRGDDIAEPTNAAIDRLDAAVRYLASRDASIIFGTDTPSSPTYTNPPGYNGLLEIQRLNRAGLGLRQILEALTINNAKRFGLDDEIGTVQIGKRANLLLLEQNPLIDIAAYDTITMVIVAGQPVDTDTLRYPAPR